jgi:chemotaxis protein methyltransferase CheR
MSLSQTDFEFIRSLVRQRSAVVLENDKAYMVETRLLTLARREGCNSTVDFIARLRATPRNDLQQKVVEALANNETSFFRDLHPFETLRVRILPELMQRRAAERCLHIWCAACSSGQEPYSVAMLLHEHFPTFGNWNLRILGSDLSPEILRRAREARYGQLDVNRGLPARLLVKYFEKVGADWRIKDEIRRLVDFRLINLIDSWPVLPPQDIILLRNVLIYFDVATKKQLLAKFRRVLRPDGYLFLGGAETTLNLDDAFERVQFDRACCYRIRPTPPALTPPALPSRR